MAAAEKAIEFLMKNPEYIQKSNHSTPAASAHMPLQALNGIKKENTNNSSINTNDSTTKSNELSEEDEDDENENEDVDDHQQENLADDDEPDTHCEPNVKRLKLDSNLNEVTN